MRSSRHICKLFIALWCALTLGTATVHASEADALAISANIQAKHLPFLGILDPIYDSSSGTQIVGYTRCGDSALWTGAYLAAESFRYKVTKSPDALANLVKAFNGVKALADVTGNNLLARCMVLSDSQYAAGISSEEASNGIYKNPPWIWVGNTSRDQYSGVIFGLGIAYDMVDDPNIKASISDLVTRLVHFLSSHNWSVVMPDGSNSTSFLVRPEEMLAFVQVGRHVNSNFFSDYYDELRILLSGTILAPIGVDVTDDSSYFKFNLDYLAFYNLNRLEGSSAGAIYDKAYSIVRNHTAGHQNAFFNMVDRGLHGPNAARDAETLALLDQWLQRPRRDPTVDLTRSVAVCGSQACQPIPVPLRVPTDFLWQRSPFQLTGGGSGIVEGSGIDYILPYWMARYYNLYVPFTVQPAAGAGTAVAPEELASLFGPNLATQTAAANGTPLPTSLGGIGLKVTDAAGTSRDAALLYVSPGQINFQVPQGTASGTATFMIVSSGGSVSATGSVQAVAPALFSMNGNGEGVAAATAIRVQTANPALQSPVQVFTCSGSSCTSVPIDLGIDTPVYLTLYGTGIRNRSALANVSVTINGVSAPVLYAGPQLGFAGLDQVNVTLPLNLRGSGESNIVLKVDNQVSNTVTVNVK